ncbi:MAG: energy transducer TonB, partial [Zoogloeaceae bacterium]|nr:energy transducer TonB [Zoogloeaceae bacterium]
DDSLKNVTSDLLDLDLFSPTEPRRYAALFFVSLSLHLAVLWVSFGLVNPSMAQAVVQEITVRLLAAPPASPEFRPAEPVPPPPLARKRQAVPQPIPMAVPKEASAADTDDIVIASAPPSDIAEAAPSAPVSIIAARFDVEYLANPKPVYPVASRRLGEEGKVWLRVKVSASGAPESIETKQSSGFERLDMAARNAVGNWRFIPARLGEEAIESWVVVPILFSLQAAG